MSLKLHLIIGFVFVYKLKNTKQQIKIMFFLWHHTRETELRYCFPLEHHLLKNLHSKIGRWGTKPSPGLPSQLCSNNIISIHTTIRFVLKLYIVNSYKPDSQNHKYICMFVLLCRKTF